MVWRVVGSWWHFDTSIIQTEKSAKQVQQHLRGAISQHSRNPGPAPPPGTLNHSATADILDRFLHGKPLLPVRSPRKASRQPASARGPCAGTDSTAGCPELSDTPSIPHGHVRMSQDTKSIQLSLQTTISAEDPRVP